MGDAAPPGHADHPAYLASVPEGVRPLLTQVLTRVQAQLPDARPCISYGMPAFRAGPGKGRVFFYAAAFKRHIGIYPPVTGDAALVAELAPWRNPKGNLAFPLDRPMPYDVIDRVALALHAQYLSPH
jgi:uncharacterized protein YdhG (YjbR/CyaY superfamily)